MWYAIEFHSSQVDSEISDEHIAQVALFLPRWEDVAGQLCIGRLETDRIRAEPGTTIQTKNLRVLQYWKARWFHQATYRKLYQVLRMLGETQSADRVLRVMRGALPLVLQLKHARATPISMHEPRLSACMSHAFQQAESLLS